MALRRTVLVAFLLGGLVTVLSALAPATAETALAKVQAGEHAPGSRFILTTHDGRTVTDEDFRGKHLLVFFGYTHCPDICPTSLLTVARVLELLGSDADRVQPLFITVDPERDTRAVLSEFVPHFDKRIVGLTGPLPMIDRVAKGYRVKYAKVPVHDSDGFYTVDHTSAMFHMGPDGSYIGRFPYETPAEAIVETLRASLAQ